MHGGRLNEKEKRPSTKAPERASYRPSPSSARSLKLVRMKRWLVVLLALLLPVQFAWAGAATYCDHETTGRTQHFGHHEHVHQPSAEESSGKSLGDNDCGTCHAGSALLVEFTALPNAFPASAAVIPHRLRPIPTALARAPDRPQWLRLA